MVTLQPSVSLQLGLGSNVLWAASEVVLLHDGVQSLDRIWDAAVSSFEYIDVTG